MSMVPQLFTIGAIGEGTIGLSERALSDYRSYRSTIGPLSESAIGTIGPGLYKKQKVPVHAPGMKKVAGIQKKLKAAQD
jgi:hypothetical protein